VIYTIHNSGGRDIAKFSSYQGENEVLVHPGTFTVDKYEKNKDGIWEIEVTRQASS
jgi:hypothetical protein